MTNIKLDDDQAQRVLIVQLVASALADRTSSAGGKSTPADDVLKVAEWVYSREVDEDRVVIDEAQGFFADVDQKVQRARERSFGDLLKNLTGKGEILKASVRKPTDAQIEQYMIDWAKTEADTPEVIATEVFHPTLASEVLAGFMTRTSRVIGVTVDAASQTVELRQTSRTDDTTWVEELAADAEIEIVCGACTERDRILNATKERFLNATARPV
jgi:hypothetical protein